MKPHKLKEFREKIGLSIKDMANILGIKHKQQAHRMENGVRNLSPNIGKKVLKYLAHRIMELKKIESELKKVVDDSSMK